MNYNTPPEDVGENPVGKHILHPTFGEGQIVSVERGTCLTVAFLTGESKVLGRQWVNENCRFAEEEYQAYVSRR